jgi:hypothetical protein
MYEGARADRCTFVLNEKWKTPVQHSSVEVPPLPQFGPVHKQESVPPEGIEPDARTLQGMRPEIRA